MAVARRLAPGTFAKNSIFSAAGCGGALPGVLRSSHRGDDGAWAFDTLGYAKRLRDGGVPNPQAEAHAEAAREFIMSELVTKQDLQTAIETQTLRLTVRLGGIVAAGVGVLVAAIGILVPLLRLH
jgi:hypothetical protein